MKKEPTYLPPLRSSFWPPFHRAQHEIRCFPETSPIDFLKPLLNKEGSSETDMYLSDLEVDEIWERAAYFHGVFGGMQVDLSIAEPGGWSFPPESSGSKPPNPGQKELAKRWLIEIGTNWSTPPYDYSEGRDFGTPVLQLFSRLVINEACIVVSPGNSSGAVVIRPGSIAETLQCAPLKPILVKASQRPNDHDRALEWFSHFPLHGTFLAKASIDVSDFGIFDRAIVPPDRSYEPNPSPRMQALAKDLVATLG